MSTSEVKPNSLLEFLLDDSHLTLEETSGGQMHFTHSLFKDSTPILSFNMTEEEANQIVVPDLENSHLGQLILVKREVIHQEITRFMEKMDTFMIAYKATIMKWVRDSREGGTKRKAESQLGPSTSAEEETTIEETVLDEEEDDIVVEQSPLLTATYE